MWSPYRLCSEHKATLKLGLSPPLNLKPKSDFKVWSGLKGCGSLRNWGGAGVQRQRQHPIEVLWELIPSRYWNMLSVNTPFLHRASRPQRNTAQRWTAQRASASLTILVTYLHTVQEDKILSSAHLSSGSFTLGPSRDKKKRFWCTAGMNVCVESPFQHGSLNGTKFML